MEQMKFSSFKIENFKAIDTEEIELHDTCTVLVGANGSGKSSVLQALHWVLQSVRHPKVKTNTNKKKATTLSERDSLYMPAKEYKRAGHYADYSSNKENQKLSLTIKATMDDGVVETATPWIRSARNEGLSVHAPAQKLTQKVRAPEREISAYIPGLAGIPLTEEKRSKLVVKQQAAAGDANTVLRNLLVLLSETKIPEVNNQNGLDVVSSYVSQVMGDCKLQVTFDEERDIVINSEFSFDDASNRFVPLEMAGIGFLQVIQIFSYLVYFRPRLLLVDEPDAHLYPVAQEKLIATLISAAEEFKSQVLLSTHSPSVVRALGNKGSVVWMKEGKIQDNGNIEGRFLMGWGLLDRRVVLITEDSDTRMLRSLISQWPRIDRSVAIWPMNGSAKIPDPNALKAFKQLLGKDIGIVVHRDRDFLMPPEITQVAGSYEDEDIDFWVTENSDIEAYWLYPEVLAKHFSITEDEAQMLLTRAVNSLGTEQTGKAIATLRKKRSDANNKLNKNGANVQFGDAEVLKEAKKNGDQFWVLGKLLLKTVRQFAQEDKLENADRLGSYAPQGLEMAKDLRALLEEHLN